MKNGNIILATYENGKEVKANDIAAWIYQSNKEELSNFLFERLYTRYIKPFCFSGSDYEKNYKNGFAIMASSCLLIETYISFSVPELKDTNRKSERCFGVFFTTEGEFIDFATGGLNRDEYINLPKLPKKGTPHDFYSNVRCGILHNGETRDNWKIRRKGELFDKKDKAINASLFMDNLLEVIKRHKGVLEKSEFSSIYWQAYIDRLKFLLSKI